jgi:hypothetical protein
MSEPDEVIVEDRIKMCRGCGKHNSLLKKTAPNYVFPEIKFFTAIEDAEALSGKYRHGDGANVWKQSGPMAPAQNSWH